MTGQTIMRATAFAGLLLLVASTARAECRLVTYCELVNRPGTRIFTGQVLRPIDDGFLWRVRVTRSFLGGTKGDVDVYVNTPGEYIDAQELRVGVEYVFFVQLDWTLSGVYPSRRILNNGLSCGHPAIRWSNVGPDDRAYFKSLAGGQRNGRIFGDIHLSQLPADKAPLAKVQVHLRRPNLVQLAVATTDSQGHFEFRGLPAGDYRVTTADVPPGLRLDGDGDSGNVSLLPHACEDVTLFFKRVDSPDGADAP